MTSPPPKITPTLDSLPLHILENAASHLDELSVWRMRATCQTLRVAAERPLRGFLPEQTATSLPRFGKDLVFDRHDISYYYADSPRLVVLRKTTCALAKHLEAYPPARAALRRLTLEIRNEDEVGWHLLHQLAPQLEHLELDVWDMKLAEDVPDPEFRAIHGVARRRSVALLPSFIPHTTPPPLFSNLTSLTIISTARLLDLLIHLNSHLPSLRQLSLISHVGEIEAAGTALMPLLPRLSHLFLGGHAVFVGDLWENHLPYSMPKLQYVVVHPSGPSKDEYPHRLPALVDVCMEKAVIGLAIYSRLAYIMLVDEEERHYQYGSPPPFQENIEMLVLEQGWQIDDDGSHPRFPILDNDRENLPAFASLRIITWVDRRTNDQGASILDSSDENGVAEGQSIEALRDVYRRYGALTELRWVSDYPSDPFNMTGSEEIIKRRMMRPDDL